MLKLPLWSDAMERLITSLLLGVLSQLVQGCSLFRLNTTANPGENGSGLVSRLELVVPEIAVKFGWAGGGWLTQNQTFVVGIVISGILVVGIFAVTRLTRR